MSSRGGQNRGNSGTRPKANQGGRGHHNNGNPSASNKQHNTSNQSGRASHGGGNPSASNKQPNTSTNQSGRASHGGGNPSASNKQHNTSTNQSGRASHGGEKPSPSNKQPNESTNLSGRASHGGGRPPAPNRQQDQSHRSGHPYNPNYGSKKYINEDLHESHNSPSPNYNFQPNRGPLPGMQPALGQFRPQVLHKPPNYNMGVSNFASKLGYARVHQSTPNVCVAAGVPRSQNMSSMHHTGTMPQGNFLPPRQGFRGRHAPPLHYPRFNNSQNLNFPLQNNSFSPPNSVCHANQINNFQKANTSASNSYKYRSHKVAHENPKKAPQKSERTMSADANKKRHRKRKTFMKTHLQQKKNSNPVCAQPVLFQFSREPAAATNSMNNLTVDDESDDDDGNDDTISTLSCDSEKSSLHNDFVVVSDVDSVDSDEVSELSVKEMTASASNDFEVISPSEVTSIEEKNTRLKKNKHIAVYWDIENCPIPSNKSAIDVVKKIRDTYHKDRRETDFIVVCDSQRLKKSVKRELDEARVTIVDVDSENKNAADRKLQHYLQDFQFSYDGTSSAVVLISGDSDFSEYLYTMRYRHHIVVYLICRRSSRKGLRMAADEYVLFEDFLIDIPGNDPAGDQQFCLLVSNIPPSYKSKVIKGLLSAKIKSVNGRVRTVSGDKAEIIFSNESSLEKAWRLLDGDNLGGFNMVLSRRVINHRDETKADKPANASSSKKKKKKLHQNVDICHEAGKGRDIQRSTVICLDTAGLHHPIQPEKVKPKQKNTETSSTELGFQTSNLLSESPGKTATLYLSIQFKFDDIEFWKAEFINLWKTDEFTIHKLANDFGGFFYVNFKSLSKARKARNVLQSLPDSFPLAPKFLKLIKDGISELADSVSQVSIIAPKVEGFKRTIEIKKKRCLEKHDAKLKKLMEPNLNELGSDIEQMAFVHKVEELKQQKTVFLDYIHSLLLKLQKLAEVPSENAEVELNNSMKDFSRECNCFSEGLPIYAKKGNILKLVKKNQVVVLQAETGSGKSTQISQYLASDGYGHSGLIVCTQPRKLAALSIAKYVSSQIGTAVGTVVGFQVGYSSKLSPTMQILYVTDFTMLKRCIDDPNFSKVSCIIVDEAHERSIYSDLLLGMIKKALPANPSLRVIITSATIDATVFCKYFNLKGDAVMQISGRTYPIEDIWLENRMVLGWNYVGKTVEVALDLIKHDPGDILVFLATPVETEQAATQFKKLTIGNKKVIVHCLHGKLDIQEQQKVFEQTPQNFRKVVFSTNCAETSLTIPGIKYVIDSGMVKEAQYDASRNLSILSIGFVNCSSAEQRRGRAGRTQSGKCYRLYSKANYENDMAPCMIPEIMRVNLGQALLKLLELGICDPLKFDFVESPPREALITAVKQLIHLGAVAASDVSITELGKCMVKFPLEPRLSYVLCKGLEKEIGYDTLVIAALATVSRSIFFRNSENMNEADAKKVRFCQNEGDFITYVEIFKEYLGLSKDQRVRWCVENCINAKSMRVANDLISELLQTLEKELSIRIPQKFTKKENCIKDIQDILFHSYCENFCIFSGYFRLGYFSPKVPGELHIHPSCSVSYLGKWMPQYVVYDTILKTSRSFLLNVTPVSESVVQAAVESKMLNVDLPYLQNLTVCPYTIGPLGETILKRDIVGKKGNKRNALVQNLRSSTASNICDIEVNFAKGELTAYVSDLYHNHVESLLFPLIQKAQESLMNEEQLVYEIPDLPALGAVMGPGAGIKEIILPGEYRTVEVRLNSDCSFADVISELGNCGKIYSVNEYPDNAKLTFYTVRSARNIVNKFKEEKRFTLRPLSRVLCKNQGEPFFKVYITLINRPCNGIAYVNFKSPTDLPEAMCALRNSLQYEHHILTLKVSKKQDLCIGNLPANANKSELEKLLNKHLPTDIKLGKVLIVRQQVSSVVSTEEKVSNIANALIKCFSDFTPEQKVSVNFLNPKEKDVFWRAFVYFNNPQDGQTAVNALKGRNIEGVPQFQMKPILEAILHCSMKTFEAVKNKISEAMNFYKEGSDKDELNIQVTPSKNNVDVDIKIFSNNLRDMNDVRGCMLNILSGDQIYCSKNEHLEKLFLEGGKSFLKSLEKRFPECSININQRGKVIFLFGSDSVCSRLKTEINSYLDNLSPESSLEVSLISEGYPKGLLRELVRKYRHNLEDLRVLCKLQSVEVHTYKHLLTAIGEKSAIDEFQKVLYELSKTLSGEACATDEENVETCPVCLGDIDKKFHRLEYCGHAYCTECILLQLRQGAIPLCCSKEDCGSLFVVKDIMWALKEDKELCDVLYPNAIKQLLVENAQIKYCPTPDCPMVYRVAEDNDTSFFCPRCQRLICTGCHVVYHQGMTCELYQCSKTDDDFSLKVWLAADRSNRKKCPSCSSPIEKNGGCNHMTCWKCQCHICWLCVKIFPTGDAVYLHQPYCPKS